MSLTIEQQEDRRLILGGGPFWPLIPLKRRPGVTNVPRVALLMDERDLSEHNYEEFKVFPGANLYGKNDFTNPTIYKTWEELLAVWTVD